MQFAALERWCRDNGFPQELRQKLEDEEVTDPLVLAELEEPDLQRLAEGLKFRP